jgi:hypothetical protein
MNAIAKRKWYLLCILMGLVAVCAESYSAHHAGLGMVVMAKRAAENSSGNYHTVAENQVNLSGIACLVGLMFAEFFIILWVVSCMKSEPGLQSVPIVLLVLYVLLFLFMV